MTDTPVLATEMLPWQGEDFSRLVKLAEAGTLAHAWLFQGPPGLGKLSLARHFARFLLCNQPRQGQPCSQCSGCRLFLAGSHSDLWELSPEQGKTAILVDQIRRLLDFMAMTPQRGKRKVVIVHPAESMNINAANALLKGLEEPAAGTVLLLVSNQPALLPATVRSRCQKMKFAAPDTEQALQCLESMHVSTGLSVLLSLADGAPLRALALADEEVQHERSVMHEALTQLLSGDKTALDVARDCAIFDTDSNIDGMLLTLSDILRCNQSDGKIQLRDPDVKALTAYFKTASGIAKLHELRRDLLEARAAVIAQTNPNKQLLLESLFLGWGRAGTRA